MLARSKLVLSFTLLLVIIFTGTAGHATIRDARPLDLNAPVRGSLQNARTKNYYAIELSSPGVVRIKFEHENLTESHVGWIIKLYDDASKEIERFSSRWNAPESSSANIGLPRGTYYILVEAHSAANHNNADYILTARYQSSDYWEKELNDTVLSATEMLLSQPYFGSISSSRDKDYYSINLQSDGYISIDFEHEHLTQSHVGWIIKLYDDESKEIERFSSRWNAPETSSANIGLPRGTYYILVEAHSAANHNNADYILTARYQSSDYWEKELNNTVLTATEMLLNQPYYGSINSSRDKDYFEINLQSDGYIRIDFEHEHLTQNHIGWIIKLYDDASKEIERFSSRWNAPETSSANISLPRGTYYILVEAHSAANHSNADYIITANFDVTKLPIADGTQEIISDEHDETEPMSNPEMESTLLPDDEAALGQPFEPGIMTFMLFGVAVLVIMLVSLVLIKVRSK